MLSVRLDSYPQETCRIQGLLTLLPYIKTAKVLQCFWKAHIPNLAQGSIKFDPFLPFWPLLLPLMPSTLQPELLTRHTHKAFHISLT